MSDNENPFLPDPFEEMVDKESRSTFQATHREDRTPPTGKIPLPRTPSEEVLYSERRHFKAFVKKLWWPKTFGVGLALVVTLSLFMIFTWQEWWLPASSILLITIVTCFVYPFMRTHFWWRRRTIEVSVRKGQAIITLYEPRSRLYGFKGDDEGVSFLLSGNVAIMLNQKTWAELYIFRKSAGGMIDTILDQDKVLHNLLDIYRPDLLKQAIEDAMDIARGV